MYRSMSRDGTPGNEASGEDYSTALEQLQSELDAKAPGESDVPISGIVEEVTNALSGTDGFDFDEAYVKASLDELLMALVALRSSDTHGKQLLDDLAANFDTTLSPGTVYPRLHGLCEDGVFERRELVKTKEYTLDDAVTAESAVAEAARNHLALGLVFRAAIEHGEFE
jgi:hypothetical protein